MTRILLAACLLLPALAAGAAPLAGRVVDKTTGEALVGAVVLAVGTNRGAVADATGSFRLDLTRGRHTLTVSYISYRSATFEVEVPSGEVLVALEPDANLLDEVRVSARRNLETERALQSERLASQLAIENIGAREMKLKGIGDVGQGVRKLTGISIASAGQLVVRGLGDRYSITTLNGQPIASPNPDNKLIPLDLFPASTVKNITVSKVYGVDSYADYSGAHIDIGTRDHTGGDFLSVDLRAGGHFNTLGGDFLRMDAPSLFSGPRIDNRALECSLPEFRDYVIRHDVFRTDFSVDKGRALPDFGGNVGWGRTFAVGRQAIDLLVSAGIDSRNQRFDDATCRVLEATGSVTDDWSYDKYAAKLGMTALVGAGLSLAREDRIAYTFFYARNATDTYMLREGRDQEDHLLAGSHGVRHVYGLMTHQLHGIHRLARSWELSWSGSRSDTSSDEPDRRQVMYLRRDDGSLTLFKLNQQETMRYFGELDESEWNAHAALSFEFGCGHRLTLGGAWKDKERRYRGTRFYYDLSKTGEVAADLFDPGLYLGFGNVVDGTLAINRQKQPKDSYRAGTRIAAGYLSVKIEPLEALTLEAGVRWEHAQQWVGYFNDQSVGERRDLNCDDLFPALNLRYGIGERQALRFSASRTVTRPSFVEMAPFLYQESYGSAQLRGNGELRNGYNYNLDLRYEYIGADGDMISVTGYCKFLDEPIERVQMLAGGAAVHTFRNADSGMAAGVEIELRHRLTDNVRFGVNGTWMYTNVTLPEGGAYTNRERALQGASPYLLNADITWSPRLGGAQKRLDVALLYNLQGPRIHAVGISGLGDIEQRAVHALDLAVTWALNRTVEVSLQLNDLLGRAEVFRQEVPERGASVEVERYRAGTGFMAGLKLTF